MENKNIWFEPLDAWNTEYVRDLRNQNHEGFFDTSYITVVDHANWFWEEKSNGSINLVIHRGFPKVGFISLYAFNANNVAYIGRMMIEDKYKHQGIMKVALEKMFVLAKEFFGVKQLRLEVRNDNIRARQLYTNAGFVTDLKAGDDRICMHKDL